MPSRIYNLESIGPCQVSIISKLPSNRSELADKFMVSVKVVRGLLDKASSVELQQVQTSASATLALLKISVSKVISLEDDQIKEIKQKDLELNVEKLNLHAACLPHECSDREVLMKTATFVGSFLRAGILVKADLLPDS